MARRLVSSGEENKSSKLHAHPAKALQVDRAGGIAGLAQESSESGTKSCQGLAET